MLQGQNKDPTMICFRINSTAVTSSEDFNRTLVQIYNLLTACTVMATGEASQRKKAPLTGKAISRFMITSYCYH
jgi:hypothetical protein